MRYIKSQRWFGGKSRQIRDSAINDVFTISHDSNTTYLVFINIEYTDGEPDTYIVPVSYVAEQHSGELIEQSPSSVISQIDHPSSKGFIYDAVADSGFCTYLLKAMRK